MLTDGHHVHFIGSEAYDEHRRALAALFAGSQDLGLELICEGLAMVVAIPPDPEHLTCAQDAEV